MPVRQSFITRARASGGSRRKSVINGGENREVGKKVFAREKGRRESYSKENLSAIFPDRRRRRARARRRLLSIPINHRRTTARINTRPKIHAGSFSCRDAIATCDHGPTFSWQSHIGASRARHACNYYWPSLSLSPLRRHSVCPCLSPPFPYSCTHRIAAITNRQINAVAVADRQRIGNWVSAVTKE